MKYRILFKKLTILTIAVLLIVILLISALIGFRANLNPSQTQAVRITTQKPVALDSLPINWNKPVKIIASKKNFQFPLSIHNNDEYVLIINNLERNPQQSQTFHLSSKLNIDDHAPSDCYFQNTTADSQDLHPNHQLINSQFSDFHHRQKPVAQSEIELEPLEEKRDFFLFVTDGDLSDKNKYTRVTGRLIQQSPRVAIYLDDQQQTKELAANLINEIIHILEHQVLDQITQKCGSIRDVDRNGKFTILLSPWLEKLQGGKTSINGFVRPSDFRMSVAAPFSNHCDMLYLNSTLKPGQELLDLLSHEVTHAAISSIRTEPSHSQTSSLMDEEDWLNEGIAHIMEPGYTNRDYRISEFYSSPESYPLVVSDYYRAQLWRNHGCRGAVSLFLDWCNEIDPAQNFSYRFAHHPSTGIKKIEQLTAHRFPELFRNWSLHLVSQSWNTKVPEEAMYSQRDFRCGKFLLAGPALRTWNLTQDPRTSVKIASTASSFLHLKANNQQSSDIIINVRGIPNMQFTLLKLPQNEARLSLTAEYKTLESTKPGSAESVEVRLSCLHPQNSTVETISLEFSGAGLSRSERKPRQFLMSTLNSKLSGQKGILELVHCASQQDNKTLRTDFLVHLPRSILPKHTDEVCLNFKAIVKTVHQTRTVTQCEVKISPKPAPRLVKSATKSTVK